MEKKTASGIMLTLLLTSILTLAYNIRLVNAELRIVGVKVGDWSKYEAAYNYTTNEPTSPPFYYPWFAYIEYFKTEVLSVTGTNITFQTTTYYKDGAEVPQVMWLDISGNLIAPPPFFIHAILFIAANLIVGDTLTPNPSSYVINATLMRTYAGAQREVNFVCHRSHLSFIRLNPREEFLIDTTMYMFWDRATGVLVEANETTSVTNISEGYETKIFTQMKMKETNIWSPMIIPAEVSVNPKPLNFRSQGKWITTYIELPEGYGVNDINVSSILLNDTIPAESKPIAIGDYDNDTIPDLMVKFNRNEVTSYILSNVNMLELIKERFMTITLTVTGKLNDATSFQGSDAVRIIMPMSKGYRTFPI